MIYKTPANDTTSARVKSYRGTVKTKTDASLLALKTNVQKINADAVAVNKQIIEQAMQYDGKVYKYSHDTGVWSWVDLNANHLRNIYKVRVMGRGPRESIAGEARAKGYICDLSCYLPQEFATHFDVYVNKDRTRMENMIRLAEQNL